MKINIDIPQKVESEYKDKKKVTKVKEVFDLPEVQAIKGAMQEHLLFIGVDSQNHIKSIKLLGIGNANSIILNTKYILHSAITDGCEKVILVHNHPSESLEASKEDKKMSIMVNNLLTFHGIALLDHIIVTNEDYHSMVLNNEIDYSFEETRLDRLNKSILENENYELKKENEFLKRQLEMFNSNENEIETDALFEKNEVEEEY